MSVKDEKKELATRIKWLLFLRVVTLTFFLGAAALLHLFKGDVDPGFVRSFQIPLIAAYVISIGSALVLPWIRNLAVFAHAQVDFDVLLISGIVLLTGGAESPFPFLYNLAIINSAILLFYRGAFVTAGFSSLCYTAVLFGSHYAPFGRPVSPQAPLAMNLMLNLPTFFLIAFLSAFLARKLYEAERLLEEKQKENVDLEALKEALLQGVGGGVAVTDIKGNISFLNAQAQSLTGLDENAVKGRRLTDIFPALSFSFEGAGEVKGLVVKEFPYTQAQGQAKQLRMTLASLNNPAGAVGFVGIFEDITRHKELEEKIRFEEELRRVRARELESTGVANKPDGNFAFDGVVCRSGGMDKINQLIQKVAATTTNILITGESGTGKELVARAIHYNGPRSSGAFVAVNCGAIPENLIESELFGHVRGAFTGAVSDHVGLFKQADGGTIFLDEVAELPLHLQVKLLRVLQEKAFTPVGGSKQIKVDVRVISATNKDLRKEMEKARFREDLFYRLNVVHMTLPPLRNRREDIPGLVHYFMKKFAKSHNKQVEEISSDGLMHLINYSYPGNIRELENVIEHSVAVTNKNVLTEDDLPPQVKGISITEEYKLFEKTVPGGPEAFFSNKEVSLDDELATHEKCLLLGALKRSNGVQKKAAELLGINYRSFRHRLEKYGLLGMKNQELDTEMEEATE